MEPGGSGLRVAGPFERDIKRDDADPTDVVKQWVAESGLLNLTGESQALVEGSVDDDHSLHAAHFVAFWPARNLLFASRIEFSDVGTVRCPGAEHLGRSRILKWSQSVVHRDVDPSLLSGLASSRLVW